MSDDLSGWDAMAAEYALGTLRGTDRARFEAALDADPELRRAVAEWQDRLLPLGAEVEPVEPPPALWKAVAARIRPTATPSRSRSFGQFWSSLPLWRGAAALAAAAAVALGVLVMRPLPPPGPTLVAVLQAPGGPAFAVSVPAAVERVRVTPVGNQGPPPDHTFELWVVPGSGQPHSLGLIGARGVTQVPAARIPVGLVHPGVTLAVSVEPEGGSPTGLPTGPVVFTGTLVEAL